LCSDDRRHTIVIAERSARHDVLEAVVSHRVLHFISGASAPEDLLLPTIAKLGEADVFGISKYLDPGCTQSHVWIRRGPSNA